VEIKPRKTSLKKEAKRNVNDVPKIKKNTFSTLQLTFHNSSGNPSPGRHPLKKRSKKER
jgi:hypothetical protein